MAKILHNNSEYIQSFDPNINAQYIPNYLTPDLQLSLLNFLPTLPWTRIIYDKYGETRSTPRLTWCYGQIAGHNTASYKGKVFNTEPIPEWLNQLKTPLEQFLFSYYNVKIDFNAVILNQYTSGQDHINWHQDDEKFLEHHVVASISIGSERDFQMRAFEKGVIHEISLKNGSAIIFDKTLHALPKRANVNGVRYNITFRKVKDNTGIGNYYYYNRG